MKAAFLMSQGGPDVLQYGDVSDPQPGSNDLLIDVHAASVNGADWKVRSGSYQKIDYYPHILGRDFSGVVCAIGSSVSGWRLGDEVFGVLATGKEGTYAERLAIHADLVAAKPASLPHRVAAAVALTGLTALDSLDQCLKLERGEKIFISGGAGGVGSIAVQLARHRGAHVTTTTSSSNANYVEGLGAHHIVKYDEGDFRNLGPVFDCALDTVGSDVALSCFDIIKPGGRAAFIASGSNAPASPRRDVVSLRPKVRRNRKALEEIAELVLKGVLQPPKIRSFNLRDVSSAHRISEGRHFAGKLVLRPHAPPRLRLFR